MSGVLGHLRFPVEASRGRRYPEPGHAYRDAFRRDRDRIIHARAFRRLLDKTQVFSPSLSDHFRNRLTHTIEVSQIARTAAHALGLNEDLTEALSLCHDFGHPPFGHAGEDELDHQMQRFGERFNHNLHSLRLVEHFEQQYARFPGLNLSFEIREGIVKHSMDISPGEYPELAEYLPGLRPPLEAQLIDLADEIAYNTGDLDDAFGVGLLTREDVAAEVPAYAEILDTMETQFPGAPEKVKGLETVRVLLDQLVSGLLQATAEAASGLADVEAVRQHPSRVVRLTPAAADTTARLKRLLHARVYNAPQLIEPRSRSTGLIAEMFEYLLAHPEAMPEPYASDDTQPRHRTVCDYIAGMTDGFFLKTAGQFLQL
jgi:dGTPase